MASAALSRRVERVVGYPPLSEASADQRREFHEALLEAGAFDDLPGKWQAGILRQSGKSAPAAARRGEVAARPSNFARQRAGLPAAVNAGPPRARDAYRATPRRSAQGKGSSRARPASSVARSLT